MFVLGRAVNMRTRKQTGILKTPLVTADGAAAANSNASVTACAISPEPSQVATAELKTPVSLKLEPKMLEQQVSLVQQALCIGAPSGREIVRLLDIHGGSSDAVIATLLDFNGAHPNEASTSCLTNEPLTDDRRPEFTDELHGRALSPPVLSERALRKRPVSSPDGDNDGPRKRTGTIEDLYSAAAPLPEEDAKLGPPTCKEGELNAILSNVTSLRALPASYWVAIRENYDNNSLHTRLCGTSRLEPKYNSGQVFDVLIDPTEGWRRAKINRPNLPSLFSGDEETYCESGHRVDFENLESTLAEMVEQSYMSTAAAEEIKEACRDDQAYLGSLTPLRHKITQVRFRIVDLTFTWPPELEGQSYRSARLDLENTGGRHAHRSSSECPPCYSISRNGYDADFVAEKRLEYLARRPDRREARRAQRVREELHRREYRAQLVFDEETDHDDLDEMDPPGYYESDDEISEVNLWHLSGFLQLTELEYRSLAVHALIKGNNGLITFRDVLLRTIAEPLGAFDVHLPLRCSQLLTVRYHHPTERASDVPMNTDSPLLLVCVAQPEAQALQDDPNSWVKRLSAPVGATCDYPVDASTRERFKHCHDPAPRTMGQ